ncbi:MAG: 4-alpha-glucanotransferase, partial [Atopobium sp.]|nr:4-alpha-glucanotransferase [Atopobium sp.]
SKARMWQTAVLQMTLPGVPSIYYGDEMGVEGFVDPTNRATMPWPGISPRADLDYLHMYRNAIALRKTLPLLVDGSFEPFVPECGSDDVLAFWRRPLQGDGQAQLLDENSSGICVLVNKSRSDAKTVYVSVPQNMQVIDVISGQAVPVKDGKAEVFLWQLGCTVLNVQPAHRLQKPLEPGMGVLAHISSLPADEDSAITPGQKLGVIGRETSEFIDFLAKSSQKYWQILPVSPTDEYGSPYAGISAFAGNINLLDQTVMERVISECDDPQSRRAAEYQEFCARNSYWLDSYAAFRAIKDLLGEEVWQEWPEQYRSWSKELLERPELTQTIELHRKQQFAFDVIWSQTLAEARAKGIQIIG